MPSDDYAKESGKLDDDGNRLFKNTDSNGRFHSDWCSMIYSRLLLSRNLLAEDGIIFISIDDYEIHTDATTVKITMQITDISNGFIQCSSFTYFRIQKSSA